jgi:hypothetical protein
MSSCTLDESNRPKPYQRPSICLDAPKKTWGHRNAGKLRAGDTVALAGIVESLLKLGTVWCVKYTNGSTAHIPDTALVYSFSA